MKTCIENTPKARRIKEQVVSDLLLKDNQARALKAKEIPPPLLDDDIFVLYSEYIIRDLESETPPKLKTKDSDKQRAELVKWLFNKYPVPEFIMLNAEWGFSTRNSKSFTSSSKIKEIDLYRDWYLCIASGGSFYKSFGKEFFTKRESHLFLTCPLNLGLKATKVFAIAMAECDNVGVAHRIAKSKLSREPFTQFTKDVIRWFARNTPELYTEIDDYFDYLRFLKTEKPKFTVVGSGFTLDSLKHKVHKWHADLRRMKHTKYHAWEGFPIDNEAIKRKDANGNEVVWRIHQLLDSKSLQQEGNAMRHCVAGYSSRCAQGHASIWSVRVGSEMDTFGSCKRKLTVEVLNNGSIVQARGLANRSPRPDEIAVLSAWAGRAGLRYYGY